MKNYKELEMQLVSYLENERNIAPFTGRCFAGKSTYTICLNCEPYSEDAMPSCDFYKMLYEGGHYKENEPFLMYEKVIYYSRPIVREEYQLRSFPDLRAMFDYFEDRGDVDAFENWLHEAVEKYPLPKINDYTQVREILCEHNLPYESETAPFQDLLCEKIMKIKDERGKNIIKIAKNTKENVMNILREDRENNVRVSYYETPKVFIEDYDGNDEYILMVYNEERLSYDIFSTDTLYCLPIAPKMQSLIIDYFNRLIESREKIKARKESAEYQALLEKCKEATDIKKRDNLFIVRNTEENLAEIARIYGYRVDQIKQHVDYKTPDVHDFIMVSPRQIGIQLGVTGDYLKTFHHSQLIYMLTFEKKKVWEFDEELFQSLYKELVDKRPTIQTNVSTMPAFERDCVSNLDCEAKHKEKEIVSTSSIAIQNMFIERELLKTLDEPKMYTIGDKKVIIGKNNCDTLNYITDTYPWLNTEEDVDVLNKTTVDTRDRENSYIYFEIFDDCKHHFNSSIHVFSLDEATKFEETLKTNLKTFLENEFEDKDFLEFVSDKAGTTNYYECYNITIAKMNDDGDRYLRCKYPDIDCATTTHYDEHDLQERYFYVEENCGSSDLTLHVTIFSEVVKLLEESYKRNQTLAYKVSDYVSIHPTEEE